MAATAGVVATVALVHFAVWGRRAAPASVAAIAVAAAALLGVQRDLGRPVTRVKQLFRGNSNFGQLQVLESTSGALRFYLNDYLMQNTYVPDTRQSGSVFTYALHELARTHVENLRSVLCIGLGIGIVPSLFAQEGVRVDVVEINPQ